MKLPAQADFIHEFLRVLESAHPENDEMRISEFGTWPMALSVQDFADHLGVGYHAVVAAQL
jgi:hypothetical protein